MLVMEMALSHPIYCTFLGFLAVLRHAGRKGLCGVLSEAVVKPEGPGGEVAEAAIYSQDSSMCFPATLGPFSLPVYSVTQLANGSLSPIMHCTVPCSGLLLLLEYNGVFCSQRYNFFFKSFAN